MAREIKIRGFQQEAGACSYEYTLEELVTVRVKKESLQTAFMNLL
jgi:hypothetical protein